MTFPRIEPGRRPIANAQCAVPIQAIAGCANNYSPGGASWVGGCNDSPLAVPRRALSSRRLPREQILPARPLEFLRATGVGSAAVFGGTGRQKSTVRRPESRYAADEAIRSEGYGAVCEHPIFFWREAVELHHQVEVRGEKGERPFVRSDRRAPATSILPGRRIARISLGGSQVGALCSPEWQPVADYRDPGRASLPDAPGSSRFASG